MLKLLLQLLVAQVVQKVFSYAGRGDGKGDKGHAGGQKRGGWLPKVAKPIKAINGEDWYAVQSPTDEYMKNWTLKQLVEQH